MGATDNAPAASWGGLLKLGIEQLRRHSSRRRALGAARGRAPGRQPDGTLEAAEAVSGRLGFANRDLEWTKWLEETVGVLSLEDDDARSERSAGLGVRIATTNYDDLIERATGLTAVTWRQPDRVLAVLSICLQALHDAPVVKQFGARRYFVRCDGAKTAEDVTAAIAAVLGMEPGAGLMGKITRELAESAERPSPSTIWRRRGSKSRWRRKQCSPSLPRCRVCRSLSPCVAGTGQRESRGAKRSRCNPLSGDDPKLLFLAVAGKKHENDTHLANLLAALDGIPLAIELMAACCGRPGLISKASGCAGRRTHKNAPASSTRRPCRSIGGPTRCSARPTASVPRRHCAGALRSRRCTSE